MPKKFIVEGVKKNKRKINISHNPIQAARKAEVVSTDKYITIKEKVKRKKKIKDFYKPTANSRLMSIAKKDAIFLHCLPRGNEVTEEVFSGKQSKVWQQAINRVHVQKSILLYCFDKLR
jgi:Ornithine carbamoyltransferase